MKWVNHCLVTFSAGWFLTGDIECISASVFGACVPDILEGKPPDSKVDSVRYWKWRRKHRGISHFGLMYLLLIFVSVLYRYYFWPGHATDYFLKLWIWFLVGCLFHVLEDMLCGKVPFFSPYKRIGINLVRVGTVYEYLWVLGSIGFIILLRIILYSKLRIFCKMYLGEWL